MVKWSAREKKNKKKNKKQKSVPSWEAIFTLARFTIPKKKQGSTRKLNHRAKLPDHRAFNQHTLVQHNGEQSAKHSYIEMHRTVGTFS